MSRWGMRVCEGRALALCPDIGCAFARDGPSRYIPMWSARLLACSLAVSARLVFVYTAHPLEQFLCIGPVDILAFGAAVIPVAIAGADRFCVSLLAFKLRNDRFSFHFFVVPFG